MKTIKVGIVGCGAFGTQFIDVLQAHPLVGDLYLADVLADRLKAVALKHNIKHTFDSLEALCASDVDAVLIFAQRHLHGPMSIYALEQGKHVYSSVPAGCTIDELQTIMRLVEQTKLTYMMGETSYYYPATIFCRQKYRSGEMGHFVYGEGEYLHDMEHGFYDAFQNSGGKNWKQVAGVPPMFYPTHSVSMVLSVTGARMEQVSCLGYRDRHEDGIFRQGANLWDNPFSNQTALFRTSDGGMARINEFRRIATGVGNCVRLSMMGTLGAFEQQADDHHCWTTLDRHLEDVNELVMTSPTYTPEEIAELKKEIGGHGINDDFFSTYARIHPVERLPKAVRTVRQNGHYGSHHFLMDDFIKSCVFELMPIVNAWEAAKYNAPGLIAHESSQAEGKLLPVPDFGDPPSDRPKLADHLIETNQGL